MLSAKWSPLWVKSVNIAFALMCPIGAIFFFAGVQGLGEMRGTVVGWALGFAAGVFLCISLADILPELQFHQHDRVKLSSWLLLGVGLAYAIGYLEPPHEHDGSPGPNQQQHHHSDQAGP
jgi:zinc and cadmium transporter